MKLTQVISAFPGGGKSHYFQTNTDLVVLDSDSSKFDRSDFPRNYVEHIQGNLGKADVILVSSHKEVREALVDSGVQFTLVFPEISTKEEYLQRYLERGSSDAFISLLDKNWEAWISELEEQTGCDKIRLGSGRYLSDVLSPSGAPFMSRIQHLECEIQEYRLEQERHGEAIRRISRRIEGVERVLRDLKKRETPLSAESA